jgi:thiamine-monophosphate kinase
VHHSRSTEQGARLDTLGEFALIARLTAGLETRPDVVLAAGDDAALLSPSADALLLATCDVQVEGQHFLWGIATPEEIGHKALAVNLSDIAAMGGQPLWALVSLLLPARMRVAEVERLYAGMQALARRYEVAIVGGNIAATSGPLAIDVTLLGRVAPDRALKRSGGQPGDALLVTGTLGAAAAGVLIAIGGGAHSDAISRGTRERVCQAMVAPEPRVAAGQALAATGAVSAMLDVSDGLAADLGHLCAASGVGAIVDAAAVPVDPAAAAVAEAYDRDALELALSGGEDYELLLAVRPADVERAAAAVTGTGGTVQMIGQLTDPVAGMQLRDAGGTLRPLEPRGWDHLRRYLGTRPAEHSDGE